MEQNICGICRDGFCDFESRCGHFFHEDCLKSWKEDISECPYCRSEMSGSKELEAIIKSGFDGSMKNIESYDLKTLELILKHAFTSK